MVAAGQAFRLNAMQENTIDISTEISNTERQLRRLNKNNEGNIQ